MKLNRLETHDRLQHFTKQSFDIAECCQDLINKRPFGEHPFYIFAHARTIDLEERIAIFNDDIKQSLIDPTYIRKYKRLEDVPTSRFIWQPRLTKPKAQSNSMLFKAYPGTDLIKVIWMIPAVELWEQYEKGKLTENKTVYDSIQAYKLNRNSLEKKEDDDLSDEKIDDIYRQMSLDANQKKHMDSLYG